MKYRTPKKYRTPMKYRTMPAWLSVMCFIGFLAVPTILALAFLFFRGEL